MLPTPPSLATAPDAWSPSLAKKNRIIRSSRSASVGHRNARTLPLLPAPAAPAAAPRRLTRRPRSALHALAGTRPRRASSTMSRSCLQRSSGWRPTAGPLNSVSSLATRAWSSSWSRWSARSGRRKSAGSSLSRARCLCKGVRRARTMSRTRPGERAASEPGAALPPTTQCAPPLLRSPQQRRHHADTKGERCMTAPCFIWSRRVPVRAHRQRAVCSCRPGFIIEERRRAHRLPHRRARVDMLWVCRECSATHWRRVPGCVSRAPLRSPAESRCTRVVELMFTDHSHTPTAKTLHPL